MDFYFSILIRAALADERTAGVGSFSLIAFKAGTASLAAGPIWPKARAAPRRVELSSCFNASIKAGTAPLAAGRCSSHRGYSQRILVQGLVSGSSPGERQQAEGCEDEGGGFGDG
jgi:hypothetical protein